MSGDPVPLDPIAHEYVTLAFGIDRLVPGFVDAYVGPPEVKADALAGDAPEPRILMDQIQSLLIRVADADIVGSRVGYLAAQLEAMLTICRGLTGESIAYPDEVRHLFDVDAERTPEATLQVAITELDAILPGTGAVPDRMVAWRQQFQISPETALRLIAIIQPEIRQRTLAFVELPEGEAIEYRFVQDRPWGGYNWYFGNGQSRVELNTDLPIEANKLTDLLCHEGYPGHHTEHTLKERLYLDHGFGEHAIQLINTPACIISEGVATLAEEILFGPKGAISFRQERVYPEANISVDPVIETRVAAATGALRGVAGNAALMLHAEGRAAPEVLGYLTGFGLMSEANARKRLEFISDPLWRAYIFTYHAGYDLLRSWLDTGPAAERQSRFRVLLTEQVYPSLIMRWLAEASR
ncbi:MAG: hypothetical protein H0V24_14290 [Chloroflexia bacterium]|nr:hypothetical protein [Chloroflexia bacterium]